MHAVFFRHVLFQGVFDFKRGLSLCQAGAVGYSKDMGVHRDGRLAKRDIAYDVGSLAPDSRQRHQRLRVVGNAAAMLVAQLFGQFDDVGGLRSIESDRFDVVAHFLFSQRNHLLGRVGDLEQSRRRLVDAFVRCLRRQHHRNQQRILVGVKEFAPGLRQRGGEPFE